MAGGMAVACQAITVRCPRPPTMLAPTYDAAPTRLLRAASPPVTLPCLAATHGERGLEERGDAPAQPERRGELRQLSGPRVYNPETLCAF